MKKLLFILLVLPQVLLAQTSYSFINLGLNYNQWLNDTSTDFSFVSAEYGFGAKYIEFYGNSNFQNPLRTYEEDAPKNLRFTMVNDLDIKLSESFRVHFQDYHLQSNTFFVNDSVVGISYKYNNKVLWFKPFLGLHYTYDSYFEGFNGYMTGWLLSYNFSYFEQNFSLFQWNEIEFLREKSFYVLPNGTAIGDSKSYGLNGAIRFLWHPNKVIKTGLEYRYSKYKRGTQKYLSSFVYTIRYYF